MECSRFFYAEKLSKLLKFHQIAMIINSNYLTEHPSSRIIVSFYKRITCKDGDKTFFKYLSPVTIPHHNMPGFHWDKLLPGEFRRFYRRALKPIPVHWAQTAGQHVL